MPNLLRAKAEQPKIKLKPKGFCCDINHEVAQIEVHPVNDINNYDVDWPCPLKLKKPDMPSDDEEFIRVITYFTGIHADVVLTKTKARELGNYLSKI